jgi:tyrosyl-tRNA synthetase
MPTYELEKLKSAVKWNAVEVIPNDDTQLDLELGKLIELAEKSGEPIRHYIGFEISGQIHIGTGIMSALKIKKLQDAGVKCTVWLADYHTWLNEKLDGNIETIRQVAREYFMPVMMECCRVVGCNVEEIDFLFAEEEYDKKLGNQSFWTIDMKVGKSLTLSRVLKSISVTGKSAGEDVNFGTLRYAPMQVADCFFLQAHIVHAGMDQRKCHVLMREVTNKLDYETNLKLGGKPVKPIAVHHGLLLGLERSAILVAKSENQQDEVTEIDISSGVNKSAIYAIKLERLVEQGETKEQVINEVGKMSKSKPNSCIFVEDLPEDIENKIKKGYCPLPDVDTKFNPVLNWIEMMIFPAGKSVNVVRKVEYGGNKTYHDFASLQADYLSGALHPGDLKPAVAQCLIDWFDPIREYINKNPEGLEFLKSLTKLK